MPRYTQARVTTWYGENETRFYVVACNYPQDHEWEVVATCHTHEEADAFARGYQCAIDMLRED